MVTYGVDVVVPARNEEELLPTTLRSVRTAITTAARLLGTGGPVSASGASCHPGASLPPGRLDATVTVVADRCTDRTVEVARRDADRVLELCANSPGEARGRGFVEVEGPDPRALRFPGRWRVTTDADSTVPEHWILEHLLHHEMGADLVAGTVTVTNWAERPQPLRARYELDYASRQNHVHGANLGIADDAYRAAGGFRPLHVGEDQDLVDRCLALGLRVDWCRAAPVATSARRAARAVGGFAAYLNQLEAI